MNKRFKPKLDKYYWTLWAIINLVVGVPLALLSVFEPFTLFIFVPTILFCDYFLISPLFGYAELRADSLFIKYGFFLKKTIPYDRIRDLKIERRINSETMLSLKNSLEQVTVKYNRFDVTAVSVVDNARFVDELNERIKASK